MKELSQSDFLNAPSIIQFIWIAGISKTFIGISTFEEAIKNHPEYFPDEIAHRQRWEAIPQDVKDNYYKESGMLYEEMSRDDLGKGKGLMHFVQNPGDFDANMKLHEKRRPEYLKKMLLLHNKYFAKYGIEFNPETA
jgi:hypothetical protein